MIRQMIGRYDKEVTAITPVHGPNRAGDIPHSLASIEKSKRLLGYMPTHNVWEGMAEAVKWYKANL
jgi:UDP-N-acetylglucosamine 4-epimerase